MKMRRNMQRNPENIECTRRGHEHMHDRDVANTGIIRREHEPIDDRESQQEIRTERCLVFE